MRIQTDPNGKSLKTAAAKKTTKHSF